LQKEKLIVIRNDVQNRQWMTQTTIRAATRDCAEQSINILECNGKRIAAPKTKSVGKIGIWCNHQTTGEDGTTGREGKRPAYSQQGERMCLTMNATAFGCGLSALTSAG
jgi:hypothetical protein